MKLSLIVGIISSIFLSYIAFLGTKTATAVFAPTSFTANAVAVDRIELGWVDNAADENGFLLYRSLIADFSNPTIVMLTADTITYSDVGLASGTTYYYELYACNTAGCSAPITASAKTADQPSQPPVSQTEVNYGIYYQPLSKRFSGAGWGGAIIGWVAFGADTNNNGNITDPEDCAIDTNNDGTKDKAVCSVRSVNRKPAADNVRIEEGNLEAARGGNIWCAAEPYYKIKFGYEDADNDPPYQADIEFYRKSDGALALTATNFSFDCSPLSYASPGTTCSTSITDPLGYVTTGLYNQYLEPNTEYYVKVRVADGLVGEGSEGWWSEWIGNPPTGDPLVDKNAAKTPTHYYPFVSFTIDPDPPVKGAIATSTDTTPTTVAEGWLGGNGYTITKREWKFEKANPSSVTNQTTVPIVFYALPSGVTLTLTDSEDNICAFTRNVGAGGAGTGEILKRRVFRER